MSALCVPHQKKRIANIDGVCVVGDSRTHPVVISNKSTLRNRG
jgi:hypothetical protein